MSRRVTIGALLACALASCAGSGSDGTGVGTAPVPSEGDSGLPGTPGAPAGPSATCTGTPIPCDARPASLCTPSLGCAPGQACGGVATSCLFLLTQLTCDAQQGCFWNQSTGRCSGTEAPCSSILVACTQQDGCQEKATCTGTPVACAAWPTQASCSDQLGCAWGVPTAGGVSDGGATGPASDDGGIDAGAIDTGAATSGCLASLATCHCATSADCAPFQSTNRCQARLACQGGACVADASTAVACDASQDTACSKNTCIPATGQCQLQSVTDGASCSDGHYCTVGDHCSGGVCVAGTGSPCTDACSTCDEASASCQLAAGHCKIAGVCVASGALQPGNPCESCQPGTSTASWSPLASGAACQILDACQVSPVCDGAGSCSGPQLVPQVPAPTFPRAGAHSGSLHAASSFGYLRPVFRWTVARDACATSPTFDVQIDDTCSAATFSSCTFPSPEATGVGLTTAQFQPGSDLPVSATAPVGARYYWRVRACRGSSRCSAWSAVRYVDVGRVEGDFNGDGYSDTAVGSPYANPTTPPYAAGRVYVFLGGSTVFSTPAATIEQPDTTYGNSLGQELALGDVNGDGFADLAVSSESMTSTASWRYVYVFHGSASGVSSTPTVRIDPPAPRHDLGVVMTMGGDLDADGYDDLVASATTDMVHGFRGGSGGVSATVAFAVPTGTQSNGFVLAASRTDVNGDAIADLVIRNGPGVAAWWGSTALTSVWSTTPGAAATVPTYTTSTYSLATGGDIDGDGIDDVAAGSFVFVGNVNTTALKLLAGSTSLAARWTWPTIVPSSPNFGYAIAIDGDVNGDGHADLVMGVLDSTGKQGEALSFSGPLASAPGAPSSTVAALSTSDFGGRLWSLGDVNGDGYADVMVVAWVGAPGKGYVCLGASGGLAASSCSAVAAPDSTVDFSVVAH